LIRHLQAPPAWRRLAFISDLHLGPDTPRTLAAFEALLGRLQADALFVLGDLFEAWVGDDALDQPYAQRVAQALSLSGQQRPQYFIAGNRDFLVGDSFAQACNVQRVDELLTLDAWGDRFLVAHGDAQCLDDAAYQAFRAQVRQPAWQQAFAQRPLEERLAQAAQMRDASRASQAQQVQQGLPFADPDTAHCHGLLTTAGARMLIHGHTHRPGCFALGDGLSRLVLSDWDLDHGSPRAECLYLGPEGIQRESLA